MWRLRANVMVCRSAGRVPPLKPKSTPTKSTPTTIRTKSPMPPVAMLTEAERKPCKLDDFVFERDLAGKQARRRQDCRGGRQRPVVKVHGIAGSAMFRIFDCSSAALNSFSRVWRAIPVTSERVGESLGSPCAQGSKQHQPMCCGGLDSSAVNT